VKIRGAVPTIPRDRLPASVTSTKPLAAAPGQGTT
jgi:hypothetical protein